MNALAAALTDRYRIERELGAGGMATVYLAEDLRHRRKVAVKVLRAELAASLGPDRFLREIEVIARLTHPHILPLHDSGAAGDFLYYVMPYVEGESLRARLDRSGELPVGEVVRILYEVADALSYAHELGVVHRDIKPDNVMLSGRHALVMDFGVAKAVSAATGRHAITTAGIALGTPAYMAPEQASADPGMDHRVDIYALGAMGYEMLTGSPPFTGRTAQEVLAAHVTREVEPILERRPAVPAALAEIITTSLAKRPADRWQSAEELRQRLEALVTPSGGITPTATRPVPALPAAGRTSRRWWIGVAAAVVLAVALAYLFLRPRAPEISLGRRVQVTLGPELDLDPALSPDGRLIAYASGTAGETRIFVRQIDGGAAVQVAADVPASQRAPRWSPDGGSILFSTGRALHVVPALGGMSRTVVEAPPGRSIVDAAWSPDGRSIAYSRGDSLVRREIETGSERGLAPSTGMLMLPSWSPDGRWIAISIGNGGFIYGGRSLGDLAPGSIVLVPGEGGEPVEIAGGGSLNISPAWLGDEALLFVSSRDGARDVYLQPIDGRGRPSGEPERLTVGLGAHSVSVAADGSALAYATFAEAVNVWSLPIGAGGELDLSQLRQETREQQVVEGFDISADGEWLVFDSNRDGVQQIFRTPLGGGAVQQLTRGPGDRFIPGFSPDGREIVFHSYAPGPRKIFVVPAAGGPVRQITSGTDHDLQPAWSPDGQAIVYERRDSGGSAVALIRRAGGEWGDPVTLATGFASGGGGLRPTIAPDGRNAMFVSSPIAGVVPMAGGEPRMLFSVPRVSAQIAAWSADSRSAYVIAEEENGVASLWLAPLEGTPRRLLTFDDVERQPTRYGLVVHGGRLYFTYGERQADVSVVALAADAR